MIGAVVGIGMKLHAAAARRRLRALRPSLAGAGMVVLLAGPRVLGWMGYLNPTMPPRAVASA